MTKSNKIISDEHVEHVPNNALSQISMMETEKFDEPTICNTTCKRKSAAVRPKKSDEINSQSIPRRSTRKRKSTAVVEAERPIEVKKPLTIRKTNKKK
jgi:hypothetical protein